MNQTSESQAEHGVIYLITNTTNEKRYVGLTTKKLETRFKEHAKVATRGPKKLQHAIHHAMKKHGVENFTIKQLQECDSFSALRDAERFWIKELNTHVRNNQGYNMTEGGDGVLGYDFTEEHRKNMSIAHKGKKFSEEHCHNIRLSQKGSKRAALSDECKRKISNANKGKKRSQETCANISKALTGKKQTVKQKCCKQCVQIDTNTLEKIAVFDSIQEACRSVAPERGSASNILYACRGDREKAYGYKWAFVD
jgi:group I intron endonuclease